MAGCAHRLALQRWASFTTLASVTTPATILSLLDPLPPGPLWRFDRSTRARVELLAGALVGRSEADVLEKANALALVAEGRASEVLQFAQAELLGSGVYELSALLRGQAGTEAEVAQSWPAGTRAVLLDAALVPLTSDLSPLGRSVLYRIGRPTGTMATRSARNLHHRTRHRAPTLCAGASCRDAHLGGHRALLGPPDTLRRRWLGWRRSATRGGAEHYRVEILSGEAVLRTVETPETAFSIRPPTNCWISARRRPGSPCASPSSPHSSAPVARRLRR